MRHTICRLAGGRHHLLRARVERGPTISCGVRTSIIPRVISSTAGSRSGPPEATQGSGHAGKAAQQLPRAPRIDDLFDTERFGRNAAAIERLPVAPRWPRALRRDQARRLDLSATKPPQRRPRSVSEPHCALASIAHERLRAIACASPACRTPCAPARRTRARWIGARQQAPACRQRITPLSSASLPMRKPGMSTKCTTGRWKCLREIECAHGLRQASTVQAPPYWVGSPAKMSTGQPSRRCEPRDQRTAPGLAHLEPGAIVDDGVQDRAHLIDAARLSRHGRQQAFLCARHGIVQALRGGNSCTRRGR